MPKIKGKENHNSSNFVSNYEKIFGEKKEGRQTGRWYFDEESGKLVKELPASRPTPSGVTVFSNLNPFKSPITGEIITCRKQLREHHKRYGTTDSRDYSGEHFRKKGEQRVKEFHGDTKKDKAERVEALKHSIEKDGRR